jgi:hypothetical protein
MFGPHIQRQATYPRIGHIRTKRAYNARIRIRGYVAWIVDMSHLRTQKIFWDFCAKLVSKSQKSLLTSLSSRAILLLSAGCNGTGQRRLHMIRLFAVYSDAITRKDYCAEVTSQDCQGSATIAFTTFTGKRVERVQISELDFSARNVEWVQSAECFRTLNRAARRG